MIVELNGWKFYKNTIIPSCAPHEKADVSGYGEIKDWPKNVLFARYTTDFDCAKETSWWYCIKDTPINLEEMKAKKRYEINRGLKNYNVKKIDPEQYVEELWNCYVQASERYGGYTNNENEKKFAKGIYERGKSTEFYAAFSNETGELAGYAMNIVYDEWVNFAVAKFIPEHMKERVAAAMVYTLIVDYINVAEKRYLCDGERTVSHKTNMQDYLENLFGFRKAYCKLNLVYKPSVAFAVKMLFPFRKLLRKFDKGFISKINSILVMEEIAREG